MVTTRRHSHRHHASEFVDTVVSLKPRVVAFDCDGTLWAGDAGEGFFSWELKQGLVSDEIANWARSRYAGYLLGKVSEDDMCGEMVFMHHGLKETLVQTTANQFFEEHFVHRIFPEMKELVQKLQQKGSEVWAVSSTNEWLIRAGMRHVGIAQDRILAASVEVKNGIITDELVRVPSGKDKPKALKGVLKTPLDAAFGNSKWDVAMLDMAAHAFAVNPNPDLEELARERGWRIFFPTGLES